MVGSNKWPWTPSSGAVAGQIFSSRREYRAALAVATQGRAEVQHALWELVEAIHRVKDPDSRLQAAVEVQEQLSGQVVFLVAIKDLIRR